MPVDDIAIYHLALRLDFGNLHETLKRPMLRGQPDILGAILVEKELVLIDSTSIRKTTLNVGALPLYRRP